ncbi:Tetratricopeptide repeat domain 37 [Seminavis robusta]|uniref:Tetratricopeptide repeat domain 37 n=1 Tax=Seminavis robusta TaxID=568900 RepID=A0A9N8H6D9_9STRA|nr:Tetratricopeptide repeat domain 37 [Seminavis robusta]|eukprot:Sro109_g054610.1 Tetratricopeptide repeat domain 37 (1595) ;mRNA; r:77978-82931
MSSSAPPKAIKGFVTGVIKDKLLESKFTSDNAETPILALFQMELVQRGVLMSLKDVDMEKWDPVKTIEAVRTSIGKSLLSSNDLPLPLLAASAVMAGRTAELCASLVDIGKPLALLAAKEAIQSALKRCKEVQDERFQVLLEMIAPNERLTQEDKATQQSTQLLDIAQGYFLRGASVQPDTPQMWKKAHEVILLQQQQQQQHQANQPQQEDHLVVSSPGEAAVVLSNMVRIASSKGNAKRAAELSLKAAESYLQLAKEEIIINNNKTTATTMKQDIDKAIAAFVTPYKPKVNKPLKQMQTNLATCQQHAKLLSPEETFGLQLLTVQLEMAQEDSKIEQDTQHQYQQAQNRATESSSSKPAPKGGGNKPSKQPKANTSSSKPPPSLESIREKTRQQVLMEGEGSDSNGVLRDTFLAATRQQQQLAAQVVREVLVRNQFRAKALALQKKTPTLQGWTDLSAYVIPFLKTWIHSDEADEIKKWISGMSQEEVSLVETLMTMVPCLQWMTCSSAFKDDDEEAIPHDSLPMVKLVLDVLVDRAVKAKKDYEAASNVLKTSTEPLDVKIRQVESARGAVQALMVLSSSSRRGATMTTSEWKAQSEEATRMAQRVEKYKAFSTEYGAAFWNLVLAWNGLLQSSSPWSFCTAPEARLIWKAAHLSFTNAKSEWGRPISKLEQCILDMAKADAESGVLSGGFASEATKVYRGMLEQAEESSTTTTSTTELSESFRTIVRAHCSIGLARIALYNEAEDSMVESPTEMAQKSLQQLTSVDLEKGSSSVSLLTGSAAVSAMLKSHLTTSRQLVADSLVRSGRIQEAKSFLQDAVRDAPKDADAAFSLGAFLLREALTADERNATEMNTAKVQLLQAAKLDSRKAGPFALLGVWYESQKDLKRALGCYSKALLMDPPNPVAGRGILRLTAWKSANAVVDAAIKTTSPVNGWAWRALGTHKVMVSGENDLGAVALLKALRCRDIDQPQIEAMSPFFRVSASIGGDSDHYLGKEKAETWSELAFCYRRIGRYTAAIRGYYSSIEAAREHVSGSVLCACAEAELSLGLAEEAAEKFQRALEIGDPSTRSIAAYGQGSALLSLAQREVHNGKAGAAYGSIRRAIEGFESTSNNFGCAQKLLGDLYSFGATLPPDVFGDASTETDIVNQIAFVSKGEAFYKAALDLFVGISEDSNEVRLLQAALLTDAGANILLQGQLTAFHEGRGLSSASNKSQNVSALYDRAGAEFRRAIDLFPDYGSAWCGLGCSLVFSDSLLAQHCFCRSLQLDSLSPDAYSNLGILYTVHKVFEASNGIIDALTQVADSPMMWINRALILELKASADIEKGQGQHAQEKISNAADAYRAALQVVKHPSAMLGIAMTCRASEGAKSEAPYQESYANLQQYKGKMGSSDASALLLADLADLESAGAADAGRLDNVKSHLETLEQLYGEHQITDGLDLEVIRTCLASDARAADEEKESEGSRPLDMTIARQIVHEPQRGDLWVVLSKQLLRDNGGSQDSLKAAQVAATRAVHILTHQLTFPSQQGGNAGIVCPSVLSDALALDYWLDTLIETKPEKHDDAEPTSKALELQKALVLCPQNAFAREAVLGKG